MSHVTLEVTPEDLDAFAAAWNRHDIDGLMSFMTDDCVFEASGGRRGAGPATSGVTPFAPVSPRSGRRSPMPAGATRVISCTAIAGCPNGRSRARDSTVHGSR
jgi:hypothetical protein